jgi:putative ATPase
MADGDGRAALTLVEEVWRAARTNEIFNAAQLQDILQRRAPIYDKSADGHYNLISALHKSVRGSDPDAALYYLCRMFDAGEDPLFLARRVGADGGGGHRSCRSAGAGDLQRRQGRL